MSVSHGRFPALRFMAAVKAARDFGLDDRHASQIALRHSVDPSGARRFERLVEDLAHALVERGAVRVPDCV